MENEINGFVIPIRDVDSLKEKILFLYEKEAIRRQMGYEANKSVSTGFTWDDYGDRLVEYLKEITRKK